jgi:NitT/TauT family transport system substrate-binding protein
MDVKVVNTADPDMVGAFQTDDVTAMVTWNPMVAEIEGMPDATKVFDSSQIPGEIIDLMVANTEALAGQPRFRQGAGRHLVRDRHAHDRPTRPKGRRTRRDGGGIGHRPGRGSKASLPRPSCSTSRPMRWPSPPRPICGDHGPCPHLPVRQGASGHGAPSADIIGIELPDGTVLGDAANVKLRFTADYMQMAADGTL